MYIVPSDLEERNTANHLLQCLVLHIVLHQMLHNWQMGFLKQILCGHTLLNIFCKVQCIFHLILYAVGFLFKYYLFFY